MSLYILFFISQEFCCTAAHFGYICESCPIRTRFYTKDWSCDNRSLNGDSSLIIERGFIIDHWSGSLILFPQLLSKIRTSKSISVTFCTTSSLNLSLSFWLSSTAVKMPRLCNTLLLRKKFLHPKPPQGKFWSHKIGTIWQSSESQWSFSYQNSMQELYHKKVLYNGYCLWEAIHGS